MGVSFESVNILTYWSVTNLSQTNDHISALRMEVLTLWNVYEEGKPP